MRRGGSDTHGAFAGPVEADETFIGGKEANKHEADKLHAGRGMVGKQVVVGVKDRETHDVRASVVPGAMVYTDEDTAYNGLPRHEVVNHPVGEYVPRGRPHTNGIESFWSMLKRAHMGTFHKLSPKHLNRYIQEFAGKHNMRDLGTLA